MTVPIDEQRTSSFDRATSVQHDASVARCARRVAPIDGIVSPATSFFDRVGSDARYLRLIYAHAGIASVRELVQLASDGVGSTVGPTRKTSSRSASAFPPLVEQAAIVRFLDHADRRIRRYIRAKQKLIKLLEEQKQAIIHRAVTRGLDPNVRLKPSGVEWLGDVPEHWEVRRAMCHCSAIVDCKNRTSVDVECGVSRRWHVPAFDRGH